MIDQGLDQLASTNLKKQVMLVKALLNARDTLLVELQKLSDAINQAVDLTEFMSKMNDIKLFDSFLQANQDTSDAEVSEEGKPQNGLEVASLFYAKVYSYSYFFLFYGFKVFKIIIPFLFF